MSDIGEKLARAINPTHDIDVDFNSMLSSWKLNQITDDEFSLCCIVCARDYATAGDFERVGHCLTFIPESYFDDGLVKACSEDSIEKAIVELAECIVSVEGVNNFCSAELFVDLT